MSIDQNQLVLDILKAVSKTLSVDIPHITSFLEHELKELAEDVDEIETLFRENRLSAHHYADLKKVKQEDLKTILSTANGLRKIATQRAINQAITAAQSVLDTLMKTGLEVIL